MRWPLGDNDWPHVFPREKRVTGGNTAFCESCLCCSTTALGATQPVRGVTGSKVDSPPVPPAEGRASQPQPVT